MNENTELLDLLMLAFGLTIAFGGFAIHARPKALDKLSIPGSAVTVGYAIAKISIHGGVDLGSSFVAATILGLAWRATLKSPVVQQWIEVLVFVPATILTVTELIWLPGEDGPEVAVAIITVAAGFAFLMLAIYRSAKGRIDSIPQAVALIFGVFEVFAFITFPNGILLWVGEESRPGEFGGLLVGIGVIFAASLNPRAVVGLLGIAIALSSGALDVVGNTFEGFSIVILTLFVAGVCMWTPSRPTRSSTGARQ